MRKLKTHFCTSSFENEFPIFCKAQADMRSRSSLALISLKGQELVFVALILKHAPCNSRVLPHRHTAEMNSVALGIAKEFRLPRCSDLRQLCLEKKLFSMQTQQHFFLQALLSSRFTVGSSVLYYTEAICEWKKKE